MNFDYMLRGGFIIDGAKKDTLPVKADIGIKGDRIKAVGNLSGVSACREVDVRGLCVCPGFIDAHSHSDFTLMADGRAEAKICQGITTEINGNCGMSAAPLYGHAFEQRIPEMKELGIRERWNSLSEYFALMGKRKFSVNFLTLAGHGNLRGSAAGYEDRELTRAEKEKVFGLLEESLKAGAAGLSTGLVYPPGVYSDTEEIIGLAGHTAGLGGKVYTTHMRNEGDELLESIDEAIRIGLDSGIHVHISHLKTIGEGNWGKIDEVFEKIAAAHKKGVGLTCDRYPYIAGSTGLDAILPVWAYAGGSKEELKRLRFERQRLAGDIIRNCPEESRWKDVIISLVNSDKNRWMEGKTLFDISELSGKTPMDCLFDVLVEEKLRVDAIFLSMSEDNLKSVLKRPYTMIGSDSSARSFDGITAKGKPHPRGFGTFARVLGRYVRELGIIPLEEAVYRMTGLPAEIFGIEKRGTIAESFFADITVFDPEKIIDRADFDNPFERPDGIYHVFVNGTPVLQEGMPTGYLPGRILR